jgi:hypothetical protein
VDESGETLQRLDFRSDDPHSLPDEPVGTLTVPSVPFAIVMNATDHLGAPIRRRSPLLFTPQTVRVSYEFNRTQIPVTVAGATKRYQFTVTNAGSAAATFAIAVKTDLGEIRELSPNSVTLDPGASASPSFSLMTPADARHRITLRLSATNVAEAALTNGTTMELEIAPADDVDGDDVKNDADNCPSFPNGGQEDSDMDGTETSAIRHHSRPW